MTGDAPTRDPWDGDVNEAVIEEWKADTTAFDRVRDVLDATTDPQTAADIAARARVSEPTARKHLNVLAETGRVKTIETDAGRTYMRSPQTLALRRIAAIHREHTKDEIRETIRDLKAELAEFREEYDVNTVDELAIALDAADDGWRAVTRWRQVEQNLDVAQAALSLYDFDPDDSRVAAARETGDRRTVGDSETERGALGEHSGSSA